MKKLKMIVTSVVVLAIVGSAFAFKAKKIAIFCVSANATSTDCSQTIQGSRRLSSGTANFKYFPAWDGASTTSCFSESTACDTPALFDNE